jgi:alkylation response protein AidB-like acyl-CoA dehydrogenase
MPLAINEEQQLLKRSAKDFLKENSPISKLRRLRDNQDITGYDKTLWRAMADMGWTALTIPQAYGGLGFGYTGLGQILEETGRTLAASPLVSTTLLGATAINFGGNVLQKEAWLPQIAAGEQVVGFALEEGKHHNPNQHSTFATTSPYGYVLNGIKTTVIDGHLADILLVVASTDTGIELFIVDAKAKGISIKRVITMDSRNYATVQLEAVAVGENAKLANYGDGAALLEKTLDIGRIGLAAEMLAGIQEAFERTIAYLKERVQFGKRIGSFQALQHRASQMFCEIELCKSVVLKALQAIDEDSNELAKLASLAKAKLGQTYQLVSNEAIQMHGGIGMTDEEEIGFFIKRARVLQRLLGDSNFHLDRLARMKGI